MPAGPTLHSYALEWVDHYAGRGAHDIINDRTRREYRRLLVNYALAYFAPDERLRDIDEQRARGFVDWLCRQHGPDGHRLCDRSICNAVLPLRACLRMPHGAGLRGDSAEPMVLPRRAAGAPTSSTSALPHARAARAAAGRDPESGGRCLSCCLDRPADLRGDRAAVWTPSTSTADASMCAARSSTGSSRRPKSRHGRRSDPDQHRACDSTAAARVGPRRDRVALPGAQARFRDPATCAIAC